MTTVANGMTGQQLAESLLRGVGNEEMRAATRLLGAHSDGYWLRRILEEEEELSAAAEKPVIDRSVRNPSVDWDALGLILLACPAVLASSHSEMAVLEVAVSLVTWRGVQLGQVLRTVNDIEFQLILRAQQEAAYGERAVETVVSTGSNCGADR